MILFAACVLFYWVHRLVSSSCGVCGAATPTALHFIPTSAANFTLGSNTWC
jgi:hypothetical protein